MSQISQKKAKGEVRVYIDPTDALVAAQRAAGPEDLILATGSFFLAGELRGRWFSEEYILARRKMI
jgi:folylpolyglutamate synthase/dihydropteroate synthase